MAIGIEVGPARLKRYAVCVDASGYLVSLRFGARYEIVTDEWAEQHGMVRIVDEIGFSRDSGVGSLEVEPGYLYPARRFRMEEEEPSL